MAIGISVAVGAGLTRLRTIVLEGTLPSDDPAWIAYEKLSEEFGSREVGVFAIECSKRADCDVLSPGAVSLVRALTDAAQAHPGVARVLSLATIRILAANGDTLDAVHLDDSSHAGVERFRELLAADPIALGTIVSRNFDTAALAIRFEGGLGDSARNDLVLEVHRELHALAEKAGYQLHAAGVPVLAAAANSYVESDLAILTSAMILLLALSLYWVFRSATWAALALCVVSLPTLWVFGLMGWADRPLAPVSSTLPIVILVVGVTDAVHFLVRARDLWGSGDDAAAVVRAVTVEIGRPTTVTATTSALGFASLMAGSVPVLRDFGFFAAIGVLGAWLLTFTILPIALVRTRLPRSLVALPSFALGERLLTSGRSFAHRQPFLVLSVGLASLLAAGVAIPWVIPENDTAKLLGENDPFIQSERYLRDHLRPADSLELVVEAPPGHDLLEPGLLTRLDAAESVLRDVSGSGPVLSPLAILRAARAALVDDVHTLPTESDAAHQLMILAEAADAAAVQEIVTADRRVARLSAGYAWEGSKQIASDLARLNSRLEVALGDLNWSLTGGLVLSAHSGEAFLQSQIASFATAFLTILAVIVIYLRSVALGTLGMIPNALPVALVLGFMGWAGINLDMGTAMIASIVLGVSVDDTIYFLVHYQTARQQGTNVRDAVAYTFEKAGKAALFSAVFLALGFFVLAFSSFQSLAIFGLLAGITILLAAGSELLILPALLEAGARLRAQQ